MSGISFEIQWLGTTLFLRAPIAISVGCRLIISVQEAGSHYFTSGSHSVMISTFVAVRDELQEDDSYVA